MHSLASDAFSNNEAIEVGFTRNGITHKSMFMIDGIGQSFGDANKSYQLSVNFVCASGGSILVEPEVIKMASCHDFSCKKYTPTTDREMMLVEALLRKCRGDSVEFLNCSDKWILDKSDILGVNCKYRTPLTKSELILGEVNSNMDESAAAVVMEAMNLSPTLKGMCDE